MHQRAALHAGEEGLVELLGHVLIVGEEQSAAGPAQSLVRGRGHDMAVRERRGVLAGGDQPGDVRDVGVQDRAALVGDLAEPGEVDLAWVRRVAAHQQLRLVLHADGLDGVVVDGLEGRRVLIADQRVVDGVEPLAAHVDLQAVGEMPAVGQFQAREGVTGVEQRQEQRGVRLRSRVGLDIGVAATEELLGPVPRKVFRLIVELAPAVVPLAGVSLGVLVGHAGAHGVHDCGRRVVLAGDQLKRVLLTIPFAAKHPRRFGVVRAEQIENRFGDVV